MKKFSDKSSFKFINLKNRKSFLKVLKVEFFYYFKTKSINN